MHKKLILLSFLLSLLIFLGCEQKTEKPEEDAADTVVVDVTEQDSVLTDTTEIEEEPVVVIPDVTGKWTGTFDGRSTVMNITNQNGNNFSGKISINYRQAINQDVKGTINPETMKMNMTDQLHSRYQGKYYGTLSEDGTKYSGTFRMDLDGKEFSFNLTKK